MIPTQIQIAAKFTIGGETFTLTSKTAQLDDNNMKGISEEADDRYSADISRRLAYDYTSFRELRLDATSDILPLYSEHAIVTVSEQRDSQDGTMMVIGEEKIAPDSAQDVASKLREEFDRIADKRDVLIVVTRTQHAYIQTDEMVGDGPELIEFVKRDLGGRITQLFAARPAFIDFKAIRRPKLRERQVVGAGDIGPDAAVMDRLLEPAKPSAEANAAAERKRRKDEEGQA